MTCFDQLCRIGDQIGETFAAHLGLNEKAIREKAILTLEKMLIRDPEEVLEKVPAPAFGRHAAAHYDWHSHGYGA